MVGMERMRVMKFCCGSGLCAAAASAVGKLATDPSLLLFYFVNQDETACQKVDEKCKQIPTLDPGSVVYVSSQAALFLLMILINTFMWTLFSKGLSVSASATEATVMNTGFNFFFTTIFSVLVFGETSALNVRWFFGSVLMLIGLLILLSDSQGKQDEEDQSPEPTCKKEF